jgi:hypothetical protein
MNSEMTFSLPYTNFFFTVKLKITLRGVFFKKLRLGFYPIWVKQNRMLGNRHPGSLNKRIQFMLNITLLPALQ